MTESWKPLLLVLANAGVFQWDGVDIEEGAVLVDHQFHDLYVLQSSD